MFLPKSKEELAQESIQEEKTKRAYGQIELWALSLIPNTLHPEVQMSVQEIMCGDPECSPVDTAIAIFFDSGGRGMIGLPMYATEVTQTDLVDAFPTNDVILAWFRGEDAPWPPEEWGNDDNEEDDNGWLSRHLTRWNGNNGSGIVNGNGNGAVRQDQGNWTDINGQTDFDGIWKDIDDRSPYQQQQDQQQLTQSQSSQQYPYQQQEQSQQLQYPQSQQQQQQAPSTPLRFTSGQQVKCRVGPDPIKGWVYGTIVQCWYRESTWDESTWAPYKVKLQDYGENDSFRAHEFIFAPADIDEVIQLV